MQMKQQAATRRHRRVRARVTGTTDRPRLSIAISNHHIIAQIVDDSNGTTLAYISTHTQKLPAALMERAKWAGLEIAKQAKTAKITKVVLDRGSHRYHGRVRALAEAAREQGLEF